MTIDSDQLLARLRECVAETDDDYNRGYCQNCVAQLTTADVEAGVCSNCHSTLKSDDEELCDGDD
jgi:hypothetical protein